MTYVSRWPAAILGLALRLCDSCVTWHACTDTHAHTKGVWTTYVHGRRLRKKGSWNCITRALCIFYAVDTTNGGTIRRATSQDAVRRTLPCVHLPQLVREALASQPWAAVERRSAATNRRTKCRAVSPFIVRQAPATHGCDGRESALVCVLQRVLYSSS